MSEVLLLVVAIAVVALLLGVGLVSRARRRSAPPAAGTATVEAPPVEVPEAEAPEAEAPAAEAPAAAAPPFEKPESTGTRLVRLRERLAGSQSALGRGLLALLSRDRLEEDDWETLEDTLLTADLGVAPTQELVERLRTRLRVEGAEAPDPGPSSARSC